jgi:hypothetical protein
LCQPRVIVKMIVEKQMECRLAGETQVLGENLPQRHFCPPQNPTWPDPDFNPGRRGGLSSLERANLNHWTTQQSRCLPHLRTETDPVSETPCFLSSNSLESGRWTKSENPLILCYTPSSEPYRILDIPSFIQGVRYIPKLHVCVSRLSLNFRCGGRPHFASYSLQCSRQRLKSNEKLTITSQLTYKQTSLHFSPTWHRIASAYSP